MTDKSDGGKTTPGSGAGDAAPTQAIPRIPKPEGNKSPDAAKPAANRTAEAKSPVAKKASPNGSVPAAGKKPSVSPAAKTDKGRPRPVTASVAAPASAPDKPEKKRTVEPVGGAPGRPITAAEYARTTKPSAATTAVIPAVKDAGPTTPRPSSAPAEPAGGGRQASLRLTHVEPWSVTRLTFTISVALMIVAVVAAAIFWVLLNVLGIWGQINDAVTTVLADNNSTFNVTDYFGFGRFVGLILVLSSINVVLMTMFATIGAHIYNLAAQLMGGVEVTFSEEK